MRCTERKMKNKREWIVLFLAVLSELGMIYQIIRPEYFFCTRVIGEEYGFLLARGLVFINMAGMALFALSVWRGNIKGRLHVAYFIMLCNVCLMFAAMVSSKPFKTSMDNGDLKIKMLVSVLSMFVAAVLLALFILREKGAIRTIPKLSSIMLLVIVGQLAANGLFADSDVLISDVPYLGIGVLSAMPYITVFFFENFILEPTMLEYR